MKYTRRQFIGTAAAGAGVVFLNSFAGSNNYDPYDMVKLGRTDIRTTRLCMGTGIRGSNRQSEILRNGYENGVGLVREAYNRGVRMFDSGDLYGTHGLIYDALKPYPRKDYVIFTKIWFRRGGLPEAERPNAEKLIERYLKELRTDYIDGVQLHCVTARDWNSELSEYMTALDKMKQKGAIRSHGISCHSLEALQTAVNEPWIDTIHARINPYGAHMDDVVEKVEPVVKQLHQAGKGVIAMKVLGQGDATDSDEKIDNCFRYVLQLGAIDVLNIGIAKPDDIVDTERRIRKI